MGFAEWTAKNRGTQQKQQKTFMESVTGTKATPKLPTAKPKTLEYSGRLSGHGMNLGTEEYKASYSKLYDSPSEQRAAARTSAIGHNIVGGLASFGETYAQKVNDRKTNMGSLDKIAPYRDQLGTLKQKRAALLNNARSQGKEAAEKAVGIKLSDLDAQIAKAQAGYDANAVNHPVDQNKYGQRMLEVAAKKQQEAKQGLGKVGSFISDATVSIGSSIPAMAVSVVAPEVGLPIIGATAAGQKSHELSKRGIGAKESLQRGVVSGIIEATTEAVPIGKLAKLAKGTGGKQFIKGILEQSGTEATEESISYTANFLADKAAKDPQAKFSLSELGQSAAMGALSGGVLGGAGSVIGKTISPKLGPAPAPRLPMNRQQAAPIQQPTNPILQPQARAPAGPASLPSPRIAVAPNGDASFSNFVAQAEHPNTQTRVEKTGQTVLKNNDEFDFKTLSNDDVQSVNSVIKAAQGENITPKEYIDRVAKPFDDVVEKAVTDLSSELQAYTPQGVSINQETGVRMSNNEPWYSKAFSKNGRAPNKAERAEIAREMVMQDVSQEGGHYVPADAAKGYNMAQSFREPLAKIDSDAVGVENVKNRIIKQGNPIEVFRGSNRSDNATEKNLASTLNIMDVIGKPNQDTDMLPLSYFTDSETDARSYADHDKNLLKTYEKNARHEYRGKLMDGKDVGGMSEDDYAKKRGAETYKVMTGRDSTADGSVNKHVITPKKTLDLTEFGETGTISSMYSALSKSTGISENDLDDKLSLLNLSDDGDAESKINAFSVLRNGLGNNTGRKFYDLIASLGFDSVKYKESGASHYAMLDEKDVKGDTETTTVVDRGRLRHEVIPTYSPVNGKQIIGRVQEAAVTSPTAQANRLPNPQEGMPINAQAAAQMVPEQRAARPVVDSVTQSNFGGNTVGAAQSAYPTRQKISKVRGNTIENSTMFTKAEKDMLEPGDYRYDVVSEKQSMAEAKQRLQNDFDGEVKDLPTKRDFSGEDLDTSMGVLEQRLDEARSTGDYSKVKDWSKMVQEKGTQGGQMIQAFAKYSRTPEGAVVKANQVISSVKRDIEKTKPKAIESAKEETKMVENAVGSAEKEASAEAAKLLPEEMLAKRIAATTKEPKQKDNAIQDMVNELFRSAKESPLPDQAKIKRSPIDALKKAIDNKEQYADVWEKAKSILKIKYADDPTASSMLDDYFEKGIVPTYSTKTLTGSISEAVDSVGADLNQIIKQSKGDKEKLLQDITVYLTEKTGATVEQAQMLSKQIAKRYGEILKEKTASKLNAMFKERPKLTNKSLKEKVMELINMGAYDTDDLRNLVSTRNGIPVLTNEDTKNIIEYMTEAQKHAEGTYDRKMWESRADQIIADKVPSTKTEKFRGLQRIFMLSNPKSSMVANPLGNTILGTVENLKDIPGTFIDKAVSLKTGKRTTSVSTDALLAQAKGFVQGANEWHKDIKNHVDTSPSRGQAELPNKRVFKGKVLNTLDQVVRRALQAGDRPYYQAAYNGRLKELEKLGTTGEDAELQAKMFALDRTFQNNSKIAEVSGKVLKLTGIPGYVVVPFSQTPANIVDKLLDYTPAGVAKAVSQIGKAKADGPFDQKLFVDRLSRSFTGTGIMVIGAALAAAGLATGELDKDKDVRAAQVASGMMPYSFNLGGGYYSFSFAQPIGGLLSMGANGYLASKNDEDPVGIAMSTVKAGVNTAIDQQYLQGLFNMLSGYDPAEGITKTALSSTSQAIPALFNAAAKTIDPNVHETYDKNPLIQQGKKLAARIPGISMTLPKKLDAFGDPVMQSQGRNMAARAFENFLLPGKFTTLQRKDTYDELNRLYKETGSKSVFPNVPAKSFTYDGETVKLGADQYDTFAKTQGGIVKKNLDSLLSSSGYQNMSDDLKSDAVAKLYEYAGAVAKSEVSSYKISDALQKVKDADDKGVKPAQYFVAYAAQKDIEGEKDTNGNTIDGTAKRNQRAAVDAAMQGTSFETRDKIYRALDIGLSETAEKKWSVPAVQNAVGSKENYYKVQTLIDTIKADKDEYGHSISGTSKPKEIAAISSSLGVSSEKANRIYDELVTSKHSITEMTSSEQDAWQALKSKGMSESDYIKHNNVVSSAKGLKDKNGKTVSGSLKNARYQSLVKSGMSPSQARYFLTVRYDYKW